MKGWALVSWHGLCKTTRPQTGDQAMSKMSIPAPHTVTLRWILPCDLSALLQIAQRPPAPQWTRKEFEALFQSADTAGWVADSGGRVVGFLVYRVTSQPDVVAEIAADFASRCSGAAAEVERRPLR